MGLGGGAGSGGGAAMAATEARSGGGESGGPGIIEPNDAGASGNVGDDGGVGGTPIGAASAGGRAESGARGGALIVMMRLGAISARDGGLASGGGALSGRATSSSGMRRVMRGRGRGFCLASGGDDGETGGCEPCISSRPFCSSRSTSTSSLMVSEREESDGDAATPLTEAASIERGRSSFTPHPPL